MSSTEIISYGLLAMAAGIPLLALLVLLVQQRPIGWQFIRFSTIISAVPITGLLALHNSLSEGAIALLAITLGFCFAKETPES